MTIKKIHGAVTAFVLLGTPAQAQPAESWPEAWIGIATGMHGPNIADDGRPGSHAVVGSGRTSAETEASIRKTCNDSYRGCSFVQTYNYGCMYVSLGNLPNGEATWGIGPTQESAREACESYGAKCRNTSKDRGRCVKPPPTSQVINTPRQSVSPMVLQPGADAPVPYLPKTPGDEAANRPKVFLPAEDMAAYTVNKAKTELRLCPEHDKELRCFVFVDADKPGRLVTNTQLYAAEGTFKGARSGGAEDSSLLFSVLLNSIPRGTARVRYQFADLARGTPDGRYEGLICLGLAGEERKSFPTWESCAYVTEVRTRRSGV